VWWLVVAVVVREVEVAGVVVPARQQTKLAILPSKGRLGRQMLVQPKKKFLSLPKTSSTL
jgi:hypothetical protein